MANINDRIKVKLTLHGNSILEKDITDTLSMLKNFNYQEYSPYHTDEDGYTEFTLWDFMRIFGSSFCNGGPQLVENNEIIFLPQITPEYAQSLFDEWVAYAEDCLHKHKWNFFSFPIWLGGIKKLAKDEINQVFNLVSSRSESGV